MDAGNKLYSTLRASISALSTPSAIGRVGPATFDGGGGGHTTTDRPLRESPHRVAIGAAGDLIAARGDRVLFVVDLVNHRRCLGAKADRSSRHAIREPSSRPANLDPRRWRWRAGRPIGRGSVRISPIRGRSTPLSSSSARRGATPFFSAGNPGRINRDCDTPGACPQVRDRIS